MTDRYTRRAALVVCLLAAPGLARGQEGPGQGGGAAPGGAASRHEAVAPRIVAARAAGEVVLDGRLEEPAWSAASAASGFTQVDPREGAAASERTEVRVLYDAQALYIGARMHDASGSVRSRLGRRDAMLLDSDWLTLSFDSYHDHLTAFEFKVNPAGVRGDEVSTGGFRGDNTWDPVWDVETSVDEGGWTAEIRIPFSQLRFRTDDELVWGMQVERFIARNNERAVFAFTPKRERGGIARFGHLVGLASIEPGKRLEVLPYVAARAEYKDIALAGDAGFANPYRDGSDYFGRIGADLKYRLTSNLTLDATVNPDFGQVEADPAEINLSAYETRFPEKRPFFIEGAEIFQFGGGGFGGSQLFYSRRIGRAPQGSVPRDAVYADMPDAATILGAAKLTGKTRGWSLGFLNAVTGREAAPYVTDAGARGSAAVEPLANYFVGRARRELRAGETVFGAILTAVTRRLDADDALADRVRSDAYAGGIDFTHEWAERAWAVSGYVSGSYIAGEPEVIERAQRASARYYQRPDASHVDVDPLATSLAGFAGELQLRKQAGLHWRGRAEVSTTSPGFETNDLGFQTRADRINASANLEYVENQPGELFRDWRIEGGPGFGWNYGGDLVERRANLEMRAQLLNYWGGNINVRRGFTSLDDRLTRGGPLAETPAETNVSIGYHSDFRKSWSIRGRASRESGDAGELTSLNTTLTLKPADNWSFSIGPDLSRRSTSAQYIGSVQDAHAEHTFGRRYLFAPLEQRTLGVDLRFNTTFRPGVTFELWAQPFVGTGEYGPPMELAAPRTFDFVRYGTDAGTIARADDAWRIDPDGAGPARSFVAADRDFNLRSLRGNAVFRWEWREGSTLYLVWQQSRRDDTYLGAFDATRELATLFGAAPENVFMVKVNYWLNP